MQKLFKQILTSRVYEAAIETSLDEAKELSQQLRNTILVKREDQQPVFSFKLRGAYNRIAQLTEKEREKGIITASAGNHAQGVAYAARKLGLQALIVMPITTPMIKVMAVKSYGGEVLLHGDSYSEAALYAEKLRKEKDMVYVHPFNDDLVIAGQGTIADEILRQTSGRVDVVFVPVGGGGLIAGIATYIKALHPEVKVIGVEPYESDAMARSLQCGKRIALKEVGAFADGVAVKKVGSRTFELCRKHVDDIIRVTNDEVCGGIKAIYQATRSIVEPAGGLGMAGLLKYVRDTNCQDKVLVAINSGANMNFERLRYVAERTRVGEKQEALFAVTIPEKPGSLKKFCKEMVGDRNITEFNYRLSSRDKAHIFVGISIGESGERQIFSDKLTRAGFTNIDLTDNDLAKTHIRHMVGGRSARVHHERVFRFWFPETPGALVRFLETTGGSLNISLFHYRMQGGDYGRVLVGLEVPEAEAETLQKKIGEIGYRYVEETNNPAYNLFL